MESSGHINGHGRAVRDAIEWLGGHQHAAQRLDRQIQTGHFRYLRRPRARGVYHCSRRHAALVCLDFRHALPIHFDRGHRSIAHDLRTLVQCAQRESVHHTVGVDKTVRGAETATNHIVATQLRHHAGDFFAAHQGDRLQSQRHLPGVVRTQVVEVPGIGCDK